MRHLYEGTRTELGCRVTKDGHELALYQGVFNHSPDGFEWGYGGSGPAQLALALCCDVLGVEPTAEAPGFLADAPPPMERALRVHQNFKSRVVAGLPNSGWRLTSEEILTVIERLEDDQQ